MRPSIRTIIILSGLLLLAPSSYAANDGHELLEYCSEAEKFMDTNNASLDEGKVNTCFGLVEGVRATMYAFGNDNPLKTCFLEGGIDNGQATRIVLAYLRKNPASLHKNRAYLVMLAFLDAYPCRSV